MRRYQPSPHDEINDTLGEVIWLELRGRFEGISTIIQLRIGSKVKLIKKKYHKEIEQAMKKGPGWSSMMYDLLGRLHTVDSINKTKNWVHLDCGFWWPIEAINLSDLKERNSKDDDDKLEDKFIYDMY